MNPDDNRAADSYYEASRKYSWQPLQLQGDARADVAVIGGGLTGAAAALALAERGVSVALLEARRIGWGASGRSGGQIIAGYSASPAKLEKLVGMQTARALWAHSLHALQWTRETIRRHNIDCDLADGYLHVGVKARHAKELQQWAAHLTEKYDYPHLQFLSRARLREIVGSELYSAAVADAGSGHLHPLNYCLGLAQAAKDAGAQLYEQSAVTAIGKNAGQIKITTATGTLTCAQLIFACNAYLHRLQPQLSARIMPVATCIVATERLSDALAKSLIANRAAVADVSLALDYYRLSADNRMLFGGRVGYSGLKPERLLGALKRRMRRVFPQLADARVDFAWGGYVAITRNRAPHIGRLPSGEWFAQGFSGHGMALSGYAGGLLAEAAAGDTAALADFQAIPHKVFPGGAALRTPTLVAAMTLRRLLDRLP